MSLDAKVRQAHCNRCGRHTNQAILGNDKQTLFDVEDGNWISSFEMLKCLGCDSVSMLKSWGHEKSDNLNTVQYPRSVARRTPSWANTLRYDLTGEDPPVPKDICDVMNEVYNAFENDSLRLAAIGIRAALEQMMIDKVHDQGNFKANMDEFQHAGYLSVRQRGHLDAILCAGHAAIHRGWAPSAADVVTLLDISESLIETSYLHDEQSSQLAGRIPPRQRKASSSGSSTA